MISYNPKDWVRFIFNFHRSDTARRLFPLLVLVALYSYGVAWLELEYLRLTKKSNVKNLSLLQSLLGFVISMLLVFRTNTAYDRWWEGRRMWGALVNSSRNLAVKLQAMLPVDDAPNRTYFADLIAAFARELMHHLRNEKTRMALDENTRPEIAGLDRTRHAPIQLACLISSRLQGLHREGRLSGEQMLLLNGEVTSFLEVCGACERIKNTPIPYSYSSFIKKFIVLYTLTLPIGYVFSLGYYVLPVVVFVFYVLASLEVIAEEIEDPFGHDENDLPMQRMSENIARNVKDILL